MELFEIIYRGVFRVLVFIGVVYAIRIPEARWPFILIGIGSGLGW